MSGLSSKANTSAAAWPALERVTGDQGARRTIVSGPPAKIKKPMYDVIYIDSDGDETPLAQHLANRSDATNVAKHEAAERGVGRMVLPGSSKLPNCVCVVPVVPEAA
jgi:hypothetical protein